MSHKRSPGATGIARSTTQRSKPLSEQHSNVCPESADVLFPPVEESISRRQDGKWVSSIKARTIMGYMPLRRVCNTRGGAKKALREIKKRIEEDEQNFYWPLPGDTNLYFIQGKTRGLVKIGLARDVDRRLATIQLYSPVHLSVVHVIPNVSYEYETFMHTKFAAERMHGEWFKPKRVLAYVQRLVDGEIAL